MGNRSRILVDGAHFLNASGTGIASYSRTLCSTLRSAGCSIELLYGRSMTANKDSAPLALATQLYGGVPEPHWLTRIAGAAGLAVRAHAPFRGAIRPRVVPQNGVELGSFEPPLPVADVVHNASRLYEQADYTFHARRRLTEVQFDRPVALAHWTSPLAVKAKGCPNVYTIHDLVPLQFPHFVLDRAGRSADLHAAIARDADLVVTVSEASKQAIVDLLKLPPDRVHVTYQPTPPLPDMPYDDAARVVQTMYGVKPGDYVLFIGAIEPKKNLRRLIEAYVLANPGIPLVIAGPLGWLYSRDLDLIKTITLNEAAFAGDRSHTVRRIGYVPRSHLTALLRCARFMAFPSIHEGFGLPVLEAMQMGVPVLTSNVSSLPEIAGDAAVLVDPLDIGAISRGIRTLAADARLRTDLAARGRQQAGKFSVEAYGRRLREAYKRVGVDLNSSGPH